MMTRVSLLAAGLLFSAVASAQNITEQSVTRARAIVEAAVEAYGGSERLGEMKSLVIEHESENFAFGQSRKPGPPWDRNHSSGTSAIDLESETFFGQNQGNGGGYAFNNATIINAADSYQVNTRAGTATGIAEPDFNNTSGPFIRVTPPLLVKQLQARAHTAHFLGEVEVDGRPHEVVSFVMEVGPAISLYFDKETHLLNRSERFLPQFGLIEYRFLNYERVAGIPVNKRFKLFAAGEPNMDRKIVRAEVNAPVDKYLSVAEELRVIEAPAPDDLNRQELADGVYLIGGNGTYAMFVEMKDYVIAVGGTGGIPARIESLREVVTDKPIRYGVMTHHHNDHILGVPAYETEGATILTAKSHADTVRAAANDAEAVKLEGVGKRKVLKSGKRRVEIVDIGPTAHAEHLLVAWLPREGILFEADHFSLPRTGEIPPAAEATRDFAQALTRSKLAPKKFVSAHSPRVGSQQDLDEAIKLHTTRANAR